MTTPSAVATLAPTRIAAGDLRSDLDLTTPELLSLLDLAAAVKASPRPYRDVLNGQYVSLLFEKPSLRTRLTFELAAKQLGADSTITTGPIGGREPVKDVARNLERWTHCIVARTFDQATINALAEWARVPVINALSDLYHPCQILADMLTLREHWGQPAGRRLAFIGDGNNVANSLTLTCVRLGIAVSVVTPPGFEPEESVIAQARALSPSADILVTNSLEEGLAGASAVYTDVWASMGQEQEWHERARLFASYQVDLAAFSLARPDALFMHCLPAHRDEEVTDEVMELPNSVVFDQAENRLHAQKALLLMLLSTGAGQ